MSMLSRNTSRSTSLPILLTTKGLDQSARCSSVMTTSAAAVLKPLVSEQYTIVEVGGHRKKDAVTAVFDEGPLVDTTASLTLVSKKTKRLEKQQLKKQLNSRRSCTNLLNLPAELLYEVFTWLKPNDILNLLRTSKFMYEFIRQRENENSIARGIIRKRYHILSCCFPLPVPAERLGSQVQSVLLNKKRQDMLVIHKKPYQHIRPINALKVCSCTWCLLCWNNLCLMLDLSHFQKNLNRQQPIPIIPRGTSPVWNIQLIEYNASVVEKAIHRQLVYAFILEKHLQSIISTLTRKHLVNRTIESACGKWMTTKEAFLRPVYEERPYQLTDMEADLGSDFFLDRAGKPTYEFPFHRDYYYHIEAYMPNRKWSKEEERWLYYDGTQHEKDVALAMKWFKPLSDGTVAEASQASQVTQHTGTRQVTETD